MNRQAGPPTADDIRATLTDKEAGIIWRYRQASDGLDIRGYETLFMALPVSHFLMPDKDAERRILSMATDCLRDALMAEIERGVK